MHYRRRSTPRSDCDVRWKYLETVSGVAREL